MRTPKAGRREARDVVVVAMKGDYGKPRPALVIQSDLFNGSHASVPVAPVTSAIVDSPLFRLTLEPSPSNGLRSISQIMIDKATAIRRDRIGKSIGHLDDSTMIRVNRAVALWFGIAT
jgi:mRNA interferase MazF